MKITDLPGDSFISPTHKLRWLERKIVEKFPGRFTGPQVEVVLQQWWGNSSSGRGEWRDIPFVKEEENDRA